MSATTNITGKNFAGSPNRRLRSLSMAMNMNLKRKHVNLLDNEKNLISPSPYDGCDRFVCK